jgi:hypothetical protein
MPSAAVCGHNASAPRPAASAARQPQPDFAEDADMTHARLIALLIPVLMFSGAAKGMAHEGDNTPAMAIGTCKPL